MSTLFRYFYNFLFLIFHKPAKELVWGCPGGDFQTGMGNEGISRPHEYPLLSLDNPALHAETGVVYPRLY